MNNLLHMILWISPIIITGIIGLTIVFIKGQELCSDKYYVDPCEDYWD